MVRCSRRHTKQHSGIWSQRLSSVLSLPTIPSSALPGCTSPRFRTRASVLNLLSHLCAAYRVGSIVKCFSVRVKINVHMKTKRWDMMINGAHEAVNTRHQLLNQHHRWNLWLEHYVSYYVFEHVKKKKKEVKSHWNLLGHREVCFWWFCPPWVTYWHLTRTSLSPPDADAMSLEGMQPFLNPTVQTFCLNIRAIAQHDVVCVAKEFREELIGGSPQVGCKTMQAWSPRNQLIWGDGRGYTLNMSPGQHNTEGQTNIARTYRKRYAANQPLWACLKEVGASQEGWHRHRVSVTLTILTKPRFYP